MIYYPTRLEPSIQVDELYTIHYFEYHREYVFSGEQHDFWELLYVDKGEILASLNGEMTVINAGNAVLYRPGEFHALRANGVSAPNTAVISFHSDAMSLYSMTGRLLSVTTSHKTIIGQIIAQARTCFATDLDDPCYSRLEMRDDAPYGALQLIKLDIEKLLISLYRNIIATYDSTEKHALNRQNEEHTIMLSAESYIDDNISRHLTPEMIATELHIGHSLLNKIFNKYTHRSITNYIRVRRVHVAKELIRQSNMNFTQIAEKTGFQSIHYFSRTFKQFEGMTPSEYAASVKALSAPDMES